jgi:leucyl-tRNA synthetase
MGPLAMSLATSLLLAFMAPIVRPKPAPEKSDRERELEGEVLRLNAELERAWARNEELALERDSARRRLDEGAMLARLSQEMAAMQQMNAAMAQQMGAQQQMAQYRQATANPDQQWNHLCNCVPGRHEALLGAIGGA